MRYEVLVGNIGTTYDGPDEKQAREHFDHYVKASKDGLGRAAGEPVTMLGDGEMIDEYEPKLDWTLDWLSSHIGEA